MTMDGDKDEPFFTEALKQTLRLNFKDPKTRIGDDIVRLVSHVLETFVIEATLRAGRLATQDGDNTIRLDHVEKILPLLMLDFI